MKHSNTIKKVDCELKQLPVELQKAKTQRIKIEKSITESEKKIAQETTNLNKKRKQHAENSQEIAIIEKRISDLQQLLAEQDKLSNSIEQSKQNTTKARRERDFLLAEEKKIGTT